MLPLREALEGIRQRFELQFVLWARVNKKLQLLCPVITETGQEVRRPNDSLEISVLTSLKGLGCALF
jgi:hypothetical protein